MIIKKQRSNRILFDSCGGTEKIYKSIFGVKTGVSHVKKIYEKNRNLDKIKKCSYTSSSTPIDLRYTKFSDLHEKNAKQKPIRIKYLDF